MAVGDVTKAGLRTRAFESYGEEAGGYEFSTGMMGTFIRNAVEDFALRSGCVIGSGRTARPTATTGEALITLASGVFSITRVVHERQFAGVAGMSDDIGHTTRASLALWYGADWMLASGTSAGAGATSQKWYRKGARFIGIFPASLVHTAGTIVHWGAKIPDVMANETSPCKVPTEYTPGVIALVNEQMARRDTNAEQGEGGRAGKFAAEANKYIKLAQAGSRQMWEVQD